MKRIFFFIIFLLLFPLVLYPGPVAAKEIRMVIGGYGMGGNQYISAVTISKIWHKEVKGISLAVQTTGGGTETMKLLARKEMEFGYIAAPEPPQAISGVGMYKGQEALFKKIRGIYAFPFSANQFVALADSGIIKMSDLKGKKISLGAPGTWTAAVLAPLILKEHGVTKDNAKLVFLNPTIAADELKDYRIDALNYAGRAPVAQLLDVSTVRKIRLLPMEKETIDRVLQQVPGVYKTTNPANAYGKNQVNDADIPTVGMSLIFATYEDLDEKLIYSLTKAFWKNLDEFYKSHAQARLVTPKDILQGMTVPLHKGAERYYKEVGWIK